MARDYPQAVQRDSVERWIEGYERAWRSPGTDLLGSLFAIEATYQTAPYERPHRGLAAIAELWEAEREGAEDSFEMTSELVAVDGATAVARVEVAYRHPIDRHYRDIWIVRFDEAGLCSAFEEWPFWPSEEQGQPAAGAPN